MPQQSNLFSSSPPSGSTVQERQAAPQRPSRIPLWLRRVELYLYVIIRIYIGVIVLVLPWYAPLWADNQLLNHFPRLATFLMYGAVRGVVSGLGLLICGSRSSKRCTSADPLHESMTEKTGKPPHLHRAPLSYQNPAFINSPDGRLVRIMSEYFEPLARFRRRTHSRHCRVFRLGTISRN